MKKINKIKEKITLHPIMSFLVMIFFVIVLSGVLSLIGVGASYNTVDATTGDYEKTLVSVESLFSLSGLKYIFSNTVSNFVNFTPLSYLIIILIGIGIMEKSGFLRTAFTLITKLCRKNVVTFLLVLVSVLSSIAGDIAYVVILPLSALLFLYGKRNPQIGLIASFAGLTCGSGLSLFITSIDSSLISSSILGAKILDKSYNINTFAFLFIMIVAIILVSLAVTFITETFIAPKMAAYDSKDIKEFKITKRHLRGLIIGLGAAILYFLFFVYNIIPGLPFSGALLDNSQVNYIDKLFSYNSFFSNGFVFVITMLFVILGFFYGIGAKTIKNNKDVCDCFGHSLDGIGKTLVLIFFASTFISIFKKTEIGTVIVASFANLISQMDFASIPLIIALFVISAISTIFVPSSILKWSILSGSAVPVMMKAGLSPEITQIVFRFGECVTMGLTPLLAYFVIYLALMQKYNSEESPIGIFKSLKFILPFSLLVGLILLAIIIIFYIIGLPIGIGSNIIL